MPDTDAELFRMMREKTFVAAVCDILDSLGLRQQAMHHRVRPLLPDMRACGLVGRARTLRWMETDSIDESDPYRMEIEAVDALGLGDVVVHSTDHVGASARWGELLSTAARQRGAVGCVCDGLVRDCVKIIDMGFPVYCTGVQPLDVKGRSRIMAYDVPIHCGDVLVRPGELIFADFDGIVVIPRDVEGKVCTLACEKAGRESHTRRELATGKTLRQVYDQYGVL